MFSLRLLTVDHYMSTPIKDFDCLYSEFRSSEIHKVPVVRIFGVTPAGQKACLHVHKIYPYLLLRWKDVFPGIEIKDSYKYLQELALEIDKSLHVAARSSNSTKHHVFKIDITKGLSFYGYYESEEEFLKIYFYNPYDVSKTSELLTNGAIFNKCIQPHQAHFPYHLQFMSDFNLSGMNLVNVSQFKFRALNNTNTSEPSLPRDQSLSNILDDSTHNEDKFWNIGGMSSSQISTIPKQSHCELELDCCDSNIMNKIDRTRDVGENPGIAAIWTEERMRRIANNDTSPLTPVPSQDRLKAFETPSDTHFKEMARKYLLSQKIEVPDQSNEADIDSSIDSLYAYQSSYDSMTLSNTQDKDLLKDLLTIANGKNAENDSILGFEVESDSEEETILMSQRLDIDSWSSLEQRASSSPPLFQKSMEIPQLDGANDDEDFQESGPKLLKEEKKSVSANTTNASTGFDKEPPVLLPEKNSRSGTSSGELQPTTSLQFPKHCLMQCSVKLQRYSILENIDSTKPVLLAEFEKSVNKSLSSSKKSSQKLFKYSDEKDCQRKKHKISTLPKICVENNKIIKKSKEVRPSVVKCVKEVVGDVVKILEKSGKVPLLNSELKISKMNHKKVSSKSHSISQSIAKPNSFDCSKVKKCQDKKLLKTVSSQHKDFTKDNLTKYDKFDNIKLKSNNKNCATSSAPKLKSDSFPASGIDKNLVSKSQTKSSSLKISKKNDVRPKELNNQSLNANTDFIKAGKKDTSLVLSKSSPKETLPSKSINDSSSGKDEKIKTIHPQKGKSFNLDFIKDFDPANYLEAFNFSKIGKEIVPLKKLPEETIRQYENPKAASFEGSKEKSKQNDTNPLQPQFLDKSKKGFQKTKVVNDVSLKTKHHDKLSFERSKSAGSRSLSSHKLDFPETYIESKSPVIKPNDKKQSMLTSSVNDASDFKSSSRKHVSKTKFNNKSKSSVQQSHQRQKPKLPITNQKTDSMHSKVQNNIGESKMTRKPEVKNIIEEQVKQSLEVSAWDEEVAFIGMKAKCSSAEVIDISLSSDEDDIQPSGIQNDMLNKTVAEYNSCLQRKLFVPLKPCDDLIKEFYPNSKSKMVNGILANGSKGKRISEMKKIKSSETASRGLFNSVQIKQELIWEQQKKEFDKNSNNPIPDLCNIGSVKIKTEPLLDKETSIIKKNLSLNSSIDNQLQPKSILPFAVKSKPTPKLIEKSVLENGTKTNIFAVKSLPKVKLLDDSKTKKVNNATSKNSGIANTVLSSSSSTTNSKLQTKNKTSLPSYTKHCGDKSFEDINDTTIANGKFTNDLLKSRLSNKTVTLLPVSEIKDNKISKTACQNDNTEIIGNSNTRKSIVSQKNSTTHKLMNSFPSNKAEEKKQNYKHKRGEGSSCNKNQKALSKSENTQSPKRTFVKSFGKSNVTSSPSSDNTPTKNSASNLSHSINSIIKKDSQSKFIPDKATITKETITETAKIVEKDSNSLDFTISSNILSQNTESENQGPIIDKIFSHTKITQSESTVAEIKIPMNVETAVVSEESKCNTVSNLTDTDAIINSDLYDTVKRRKTRLNSKTGILDSTDSKVLSESSKTLTTDSKPTRSGATTSKPDALIANSKTSKLRRNSTITSKPDTSSSSKINDLSQSVDTKSFTLEVKCNAETEPKVSSIDKSSVFSADTPLLISRERRISTRRSRDKDLVQLNSEKLEPSLSSDSPSSIQSTNDKDKPSENSISLFPKRQASKRGRDDNNFGFFSNKNSKRRRNCQETTANPKSLSSKLSLEAKVAQNNKSEGHTIENTVKQEIFEQEEIRDDLSHFDFDENASIEPTISASYSSRRCKNNRPRGKNKASSVKSPKKLKKNLNIMKNKKDINCKTTRSNQLNISKNQPINGVTPVKGNNSKLEPMQKSPTIKLKRNSYGEICVVNPTINRPISTSLSEDQSDFLSPSKPKGMRPGNIIKSDLEGKPSIKLKICLEKKECVIINSDSESETDDQPKAVPKKRSSRTRSEPFISPCEPIVPPILIKNIKKEKLDDFEQQPYIAPLKLKLNVQDVNNCNRINLSKPKCEPIKLCRNADQFYISPTASNHPQNETFPKRGRGRPRKNTKHESPSKIETPNVIDKIPILKLPKLSFTNFSANDTSAKPLSRKTRSNSARTSTSNDYASIKIKKEPVSEDEYIPSAATSESPMPSAIKTRRRSSLKCENFKKFFDSDSDDSELKTTTSHSPRKKKSIEETKNRTNIKLKTNKSAESDECQVVYSSLPEKRKRLRKKRNSSPTKRKSCSVNNTKVMDVTKNNLPECTVNLRRLSSAYIDKHLLVSHYENEKERESVYLAPTVTEVQNSVTENFKESSTKLKTFVNQVVSKKFFEGNYQTNSLPQRQIKNLDRDDVFLENHKISYNTPIEVRNLDTTVNLNTIALPESSPENKIVNSTIVTPFSSPNQDNPLSITSSSIEREKDSGVPSFFVKGNGTYGGHIWDSPVLCGNHDSPQGGQTSPPDLNQAIPLKVNSNLQTNDTNTSKPGVSNTCVSYTTKGAESPVLPKPKNVEGNMFDKVTLKMKNAVHPQNDIFNNSQSKHYFSDNNFSLSNTQKSPYNALEDINKASVNQTNPNNQPLFKSIQEDLKRSQDNQAVSCFKGYDLLSDTGTMPPASSHMLKTLSHEQSQSSYSHPRMNKQNSDSNEILESIFSIQENENKYSTTFCNQKSNFHENQNTNNVFGAAQWPSVSTSFYSHDLFSHGPTSNPLPMNKSDACENKLEISSHELFPKQQFNNAEISYLPNIFSSPNANTSNRFSEDTKAFPNEQISSPVDNYATEISNSDATLLDPSFEKLPVSNYSSKALATESGSHSLPSYDANKHSSTALSDDDDAEKTLKSLSDVLAGSALDVDNDSVSLNCDIYSTSLGKATTENMPVSNITETPNKSEESTSTVADKEVIPVNKFEDSKPNHFPTLDFTCLTENNIDHNLLDFDDITYHSPAIEGNISNVSISTEKKSNPNSLVATDTKSNNSNITSDVKESNTLFNETLSDTSSNLTTIISSSNASAPFELCFGNNMPLVSLTNQPSNPCFQQLSLQAFNSVDQSFVPTLMVKESVLVPAPNFFIGNASIANEDSVSKDIVSILPNSASDNSTVESDSKSSSDQGVSKFKQCINVDNIMDECGISVAYMSSPAVDINETQSNIVDDETAADNMILSFYGNDTLIDLNQTQTFSSNLQNMNTAISATDLHVDNAIPSSHFSNSSTISNPVPELVNQAVAENNSCGLPGNEINRVIPIPRIPKHSIFAHKSDVSKDSLSFSGVTKKRKKEKEMNDIFNDGSQSSTYKKTSHSPSFSYEMNNSTTINKHQEKLQALISTPANPHGIRNFLSDQLGVSPINNNNLLNGETKKKRRLFEKKSVPYDKKSDTDTTTGGYKRFWENNSLTSRGLGSEKNLSNSDIDGPTLENSRGYKVNVDDLGEGRVRQEVQHLTIMSLEIHVNTRNELKPDPRFDSVAAIFYSIYNDVGHLQQGIVGMIVVDYSSSKTNSLCKTYSSLNNFLSLLPCVKKSTVYCVKDEIELFQQLISIVRESDPDILVGYEIQMASWGYLIERADILELNLLSKLSRLICTYESKLQKVDQDPTVTDQTADLDRINIPGRIVLNLWRLLRKEVSLNVYTFENVYFHLLHKRTPLFQFQELTYWFSSGTARDAVVQYYVIRVVGCIQFLEKFDLIQRTSEMARLFGIQFYEVLSRGSQYRVESMMIRQAASKQHIFVTPSIQQRSKMRAPEFVPLILEPQSKYYQNPVLVFDFQSLYPSMMIAYNYCFSTCLGRIDSLCKGGSFNFGCTSLDIPTDVLYKLISADNIHFSPVGVGFVKPHVRRGILPTMLEEILNTRVLVKQSMKKNHDNAALKKLLDARQLALKLIANVTYGYTAANFSGRMPCVEVADSIVSKGRETLERAIQSVEEESDWEAKVVYGDTDSFFVELPGSLTKEETFKRGQEIVDAVTAANPKPVKLKLEKVYRRLILESKKRYVGFMYETVDQIEPIFEAKGIETVRRDSCPATAKILEKSLKILFRTDAVNLVQQYVQKQFRKLLAGRVNIADLIFAKEYRGKAGYRPTACVPALEIAKRRLAKDPRSEPRVGERVPYVVVYGFPDAPIIKLVHEPAELLKDTNLRINTTYYITRVISPPLDRVFSLMNHDVKTWFSNIAHTVKLNLPMLQNPNHHRETITQYFTTRNCPSCEATTTTSLCETCRKDPQGTIVTLQEKIRKWERTESNFKKICTSCSKSTSNGNLCASMDCPIIFKLNLAKRNNSQIPYLKKVLAQELF